MPLSPQNQLLINRPSQRSTQSLPPNPQPQPPKKTAHPILPNHQPPGAHHIPIPPRHKLQPRLNRIKRISNSRREPRGKRPGDEIDTRGRRGRARHTAEPALHLLVEEDVEAGVGGVAGGGGAEAGEEAAQALGAEDVAAGAGEGAVGVVV